MKGIIYEYYNSTTDMYYIGQTILRFSKRDWEHRHNKHTNSWFDNAYKKHPTQFTNKILVTIEQPSKELLIEELNKLEIYYIAHYKNNGKKLYNILEGGNSGWHNAPLSEKALQALKDGRQKAIQKKQENKLSEEEAKARHNTQSKKYNENNKEKYKEIYTNANQRRKEAKKQWYQEHKEEIAYKAKLRYEKNKETKKQYNRERYQNKKEEIREKRKLYYLEHAEEYRTRSRKWHFDHKIKLQESP